MATEVEELALDFEPQLNGVAIHFKLLHDAKDFYLNTQVLTNETRRLILDNLQKEINRIENDLALLWE